MLVNCGTCVCVCSYVCVCVCVSHETIECRILNAGSLEMWGGATFDVALRCLHECPLKLHMCACMCMHVMKTIKHRILHAGSLEMWGGATFDVALRYLHECPLKLHMCACMCVHVMKPSNIVTYMQARWKCGAVPPLTWPCATCTSALGIALRSCASSSQTSLSR